MIAEVIVDIAHSEVDKIFDYDTANLPLQPGMRVLVSFGRQITEGYIIKLKEHSDFQGNLKKIIKALDPYPIITPEQLELVWFMVDRYNVKIVDALRAYIPAELRGGRVSELRRLFVSFNNQFTLQEALDKIGPRSPAQAEAAAYIYNLSEPAKLSDLNKLFSASIIKTLNKKGIITIAEKRVGRTPYKELGEAKPEVLTLTDEQKNAVDQIINGGQCCYLLHGVTGSGKTEVYISCITHYINQGKTAILLVPEISLTPQMLRLFRARFGPQVAILHSALSSGERYDEWSKLLSGKAKIAIGARSAIFAPLKNLGIIIIDEEHDGSYISENPPKYYTHDIALFRQKYNSCRLVLGSATPSVETYQACVEGQYKLLELKRRINQKPMPKIQIVNMCDEARGGNLSVFSKDLQLAMHKEIAAGNQVILFLNRRGYASYQMCRLCGFVVKCEDCDVSMVYHRDEGALKCHYCSRRSAPMDVCPQCGSDQIKQGAAGTQRLVAELNKLFPNVKVLRMDNDTTRNKDSHLKIIRQFAQGQAQILVGTQMVAKGHDFPNVTLVGIIDADLSLYFADYRSIEKTFQLITQVSGRAGRADKEGLVILQTYTPRHYVYRYAVNNDYNGFFGKEINIRQVTKYPPFTYLLRIMSVSKDEEKALAALKEIHDQIKPIAQEFLEDFVYFKAMKSPVKRIKGQYRFQILLRLARGNIDIILKRIYNLINNIKNRDVLVYSELNPQDLN